MGPIAKFRMFLAIVKMGDSVMWANLFSSGALKSKTVWVGVLQVLLPLIQAYASGGVVSVVDLWPVITGVGTILARAAATQPLAAK
jgi:hypothetical protein